jgi:ergothioneine biosynthesis protein EgtB
MSTTLRPIDLDRNAVKARLLDARRQTDHMFHEVLASDAIYERPVPERNRLIFYFGHVEAFDMNIIVKSGFGRPSFHPDFDQLFAFGIDPIDGGLPNEPASDWPALADVRAYRDRARSEVDALIDHGEIPDPQRAHDVFHTGIEHRYEHAETLSYLFHQLPTHMKLAPTQPSMPETAFRPGQVAIPAGTATLGRARGHGFGWDNEFDEHQVQVKGFSIDRYSVTNRQFMEFLKDGGYANRKLWSDADWAWREAQGIRHPAFWVRRESGWYQRGMFAEVALPESWPVYVSHAEATAYGRWAGKRLPTEAEFHRAAYGTQGSDEREYPWGEAPPEARHGNFDFHRWDPAPVGSYPDGQSAFGVADLVGNGYEWTSSEFRPFDGFEVYDFYPGYSQNFFDGKHFVMKGGSPRTAACMLRRSFRNWFQGHYPYMYGKFRLVSA